MPTFTLGLPLREHDEAPAARLVASRYRTQHHEDLLVPSLIESLPTLVHHLDEPSDSLSVCTWLVARTARGHVKVVLGGDGGDELFGGYDRYYGNLYADYYAALPAALRRVVGAVLMPLVPARGWYKSKGHQLRWLHQASFLEGGERYARSLGYFYVRRELTARLFGPALAGSLANFDPYAAIRQAYERARASHPIDRMLHADSRLRLPDHPVMILDRTSMAHGLEARAPFMDHKLAEFAARLPVSLKVRGRTLRYAQRRLCERYLPPELLKRKKQGFASSLPYLLGQQYGQLQRALLADSWLARDGMLQASGICDLLAEHGSGAADHGNRLWLLINAEAWYRMKICGLSAAELGHTIARAAAPG
jgi:asparagine synthase (glutamine-hydrolysing)